MPSKLPPSCCPPSILPPTLPPHPHFLPLNTPLYFSFHSLLLGTSSFLYQEHLHSPQNGRIKNEVGLGFGGRSCTWNPIPYKSQSCEAHHQQWHHSHKFIVCLEDVRQEISYFCGVLHVLVFVWWLCHFIDTFNTINLKNWLWVPNYSVSPLKFASKFNTCVVSQMPMSFDLPNRLSILGLINCLELEYFNDIFRLLFFPYFARSHACIWNHAMHTLPQNMC